MFQSGDHSEAISQADLAVRIYTQTGSPLVEMVREALTRWRRQLMTEQEDCQ